MNAPPVCHYCGSPLSPVDSSAVGHRAGDGVPSVWKTDGD